LVVFKVTANEQGFVSVAELIGTKSEFGQHDFLNNIFDIILFDVEDNRKGLVPPKQFIKDFTDAGIPKIIYEGNFNKEFASDVQNNFWNLTEGVICKGIIPNRKDNNLFYCKIKTTDWFELLRSKHILLSEPEINQSLK
jgi:hypothetical protein